MHQPLWQNWLNIIWIAFVARRAAIGIGLHWNQLTGFLRFGYCTVLAVCAAAAIAVWLPARWVIVGLVGVAAAFTLITMIEMTPGLSTLPLTWGVMNWLIGMFAGVLLIRLAWQSEEPHAPGR